MGLGQEKRERGRLWRCLEATVKCLGFILNIMDWGQAVNCFKGRFFLICLWLLSGTYNGTEVEFEEGKQVRMLLWKTKQ